MSDHPTTPESQSYSRRKFLCIGAVTGLTGFGSVMFLAPNRSESDEFYSQHRESHSTVYGDTRLDASLTARSFTGAESVEITTEQSLDWQGDESRLVDIDLRSTVAISGNTSATDDRGNRPEPGNTDGVVVTEATYESVDEARNGFTQFRIEFDQYPFRKLTHSVSGTVNLGDRTFQLDVDYAHNGEEFGKLE